MGHQLPNTKYVVYIQIDLKCSVAQQPNVYMGVWSRYLRRHMCWSLGIHICARVVFAYFKTVYVLVLSN